MKQMAGVYLHASLFSKTASGKTMGVVHVDYSTLTQVAHASSPSQSVASLATHKAVFSQR